jgi:hypothetical protein
LEGNVIVDSRGRQKAIDTHRRDTFAARRPNYVVGVNPIVVDSSETIQLARADTLNILRDLFNSRGETPFKILGRSGKAMDERQVDDLIRWFRDLRAATKMTA